MYGNDNDNSHKRIYLHTLKRRYIHTYTRKRTSNIIITFTVFTYIEASVTEIIYLPLRHGVCPLYQGFVQVADPSP